MSRRSLNFIAANEVSPIVYQSVDARKCVTIRLADGKVFRLNAEDARQVPSPRWAYAVAA